jgi:hypothetical protein
MIYRENGLFPHADLEIYLASFFFEFQLCQNSSGWEFERSSGLTLEDDSHQPALLFCVQMLHHFSKDPNMGVSASMTCIYQSTVSVFIPLETTHTLFPRVTANLSSTWFTASTVHISSGFGGTCLALMAS